LKYEHSGRNRGRALVSTTGEQHRKQRPPHHRAPWLTEDLDRIDQALRGSSHGWLASSRK
jgi:hypothetical protein